MCVSNMHNNRESDPPVLSRVRGMRMRVRVRARMRAHAGNRMHTQIHARSHARHHATHALLDTRTQMHSADGRMATQRAWRQG